MAAAACPGCGHSFKSSGLNMSDPVHVIGVLVLIAFVIGIAVYLQGAM